LPPCASHTLSIARALIAYDFQYGTLPPAFITNDEGQPLHSWRVLILPFLEEQAKYDQYRFDEPWNGPHNRQLLEPMPAVFACHSQPNSPYTNYMAVVGPDTAWPGTTCISTIDFADGMSESILIVEAGEPRVLWMEPRDLAYDEALRRLSGEDGNARHDGHWIKTFFTERYAGRQVAFADGHTQFVEGNFPSIHLAAGLNVRDGKGIVENEFDWPRPPARHRVGNYIRAVVWILVAILPLPFVVATSRTREMFADGRSHVDVDQSLE
jgi:hypothetical protein